MKKLISFILLSVLIISSCKKDKDDKSPEAFYHAGYGNHLSTGRSNMAAAVLGNKAFFAGGSSLSYSVIPTGQFTYYNNVDMYDAGTNQWSTATLSQVRSNLAAAALGNKVMFAGGNTNPAGLTNTSRIDIYDVATSQWSIAELSQARSLLAGAALGNKIVFAGGYTSGGLPSSRVDIYDITTGQWSTTELSEARFYMAAAAAGNKIVFAGGYNATATGYSNKVDIYDVSTGQWSTATLSESRAFLGAAASGNKIVIAGGYSISAGISDKADIYDVSNGQWSVKTLSAPRHNFAVTGIGDFILLAGGSGPDESPSVTSAVNSVEVLDLAGSSGNAFNYYLKERVIYPSAVTVGNKVLVAGGVADVFVSGERRALNHSLVNYFELR